MKIYHSMKGTSWVNEGGHLLVVDEARSAAYIFSGAEAVLWRWLHQNFTWPDVRDLFSALVNLPPKEGEAQIKEIIGRWVEAGLLETIDG